MRSTPRFQRYIGIDYSGAETPTSSLKSLRVYQAIDAAAPEEVEPPPGPRSHWTRKDIALWLAGALAERAPTIVGIDHGFSFPMRYFEAHRLPPDWPQFLDDFRRHWPTDEDNVYVDFVRDGVCGNGADRGGDSGWRRLTETRARIARSVFQFEGHGAIAKATHAGIPWLRFVRNEVGPRAHFWPFDGWSPPVGACVVCEVHPAFWAPSYPSEGRNADQHDAFSIARWMQESDRNGKLARSLTPALEMFERTMGRVEGWILGVA